MHDSGFIRSVAALRRKLRALGAVAQDARTSAPERANAAALKKRLEQLDAVVFYVDLSEYLLLTKEVEISDFLVSIAGAMSEQVQNTYGGSPGNLSYWDRLSAFLQTKVEFKELGVKLAGVDVKAALKNDPDFKRRVQEAARGHVAQLVQDAHGFLAEAARGTFTLTPKGWRVAGIFAVLKRFWRMEAGG